VVLWSPAAPAAARFGGEVQRWGATNASSTTVITLASGIAQGNTAVTLFGWEAGSVCYVTSLADSRGNTWSVIGTNLDNSVHQSAMASAYVTTALQSGDTITVNWVAPSSFAKAGVIVYLTGAANAAPDLVVTNGSYGTTVTAPGTTTIAGDALVGFVQIEQTPTYTAGAWTQSGAPDLYGHTSSTAGLASYYLYDAATAPGSYDPGGALSPIYGYDVMWAAFSPATPSTVYYVDFAAGSDAAAGTSTGAAWKHCPGDANAAGTAAGTTLGPGNTVIFKGGSVYVGEVMVQHDGTAASPIIYDGNSAGNWGSGMAILDLQSNFYSGFAAYHTAGPHNNIVIQGFDIKHAKNNSNFTGFVNVVQGSQDSSSTTNWYTMLGDNSVYDVGLIYAYGTNWMVQNCNLHESENWWFRAPATGYTGNPIICEQVGIAIASGSLGVVVSNCAFWGIGSDCIDAAGTNISILACNMGGPSTVALANRGWFAVGVRVGYVANCTIAKCVMHDGWQYEGDDSAQRCHAGDWIHIYGNSNGLPDGQDVYNLLIDSCWLYNDYAFSYANSTAFIYPSGDVWGMTVRNCLLVNPHHMALWLGAGSGVVTNLAVLNNTIVAFNQTLGGSFTVFQSGLTNQMGLTNNLVVNLNNNGSLMPFCVSTAVNPTNQFQSDYNLLYNPLTDQYGSINLTNVEMGLSVWGAATGNDTHSVTNNPLFVSLPATGAASSSGNFALASGSPAIGAGVNLSALFTTDASGRQRGAVWDIGAYAYAAPGLDCQRGEV